MQCHAAQASRGRLSLYPPLFWTPNLTRALNVWCIVLVGAKRSAAASVSIGDHDAGGTQRSFPVPPGPAREATPLIFRGVVGTAAPLALPRSREDGSRSQRSRHSAENRRKSRGDPIELRVESALACPRRKIWKKRTVPAPDRRAYMRSIWYNQKTTPCIKWHESQRETQLSVLRLIVKKLRKSQL